MKLSNKHDSNNVNKPLDTLTGRSLKEMLVHSWLSFTAATVVNKTKDFPPQMPNSDRYFYHNAFRQHKRANIC